MKTIGVFEAKTHLSQLLTEVENDREFIIQRRGKNIAILQPYHQHKATQMKKKGEQIISAFREIRNSQKTTGKDKLTVKELINSDRKY